MATSGPQPVVLTGANGAGKTNLLEAISFLSPGRGLRHAALEDPIPVAVPDGGWFVHAEICPGDGKPLMGIGTGINRESGGGGEKETLRRVVRIDGQTAGQAALADHLHVIWLTPRHDGLFTGAASDRRRFFDRLAYGFAPEHARFLSRYERLLRERNRLLVTPGAGAGWFDGVEAQLAETGVAIAAGRRQALDYVTQAMTLLPGDFPRAELIWQGEAEEWIGEEKALTVEARYRERLAANRALDRQTGRTGFGVHRSDVAAFYAADRRPAATCSTGEQKALLLSVLLAQAQARRHWQGQTPVMLLDEVAAHLDAGRRAALFGLICELGVQTWMSGTDRALFSALEDKALFVDVRDGALLVEAPIVA